ncbi:MAG: 23S rRNA (uracil(1939)-C(5))-methyltransferase RlmD [Clostridia bacterium]|nr:23S rRNA (uracil(1939)-C(5))-methyltransferase RlmD [Clostridia bacterium]
MLTKNQVIPLTITAMSAEGSGIGRYTPPGEDRGMAVFVPFTAVGDEISCRIVKVQKNLAYGKKETIIKPSPDRLPEQDCPAFGKCGGCVYRHITYEAELRCKWQRVADALQRIGGLSVVPQPIVPCDEPNRYRNKAQYPVVPGEHRPIAGLYAARSHRVIEQRDCLLQPAVFEAALTTVVKWAKENRVPIYDETTGKGLLRHVYIREGEQSGERMVCLVCTHGKLPHADTLVAALKDTVPGLASVMVNLNAEDTNVVLGDTCYSLYGKPFIVDTLCGLTFRLSPLSFYQVNRAQAERLYGLAAEAAALTGEEALLDLYCGTGTIGLSMAHRARELVGVEVVPAAVEDAVRNAAENGITNARFMAADAAKAAKQLAGEGWKPDVVVLDPPRKGCDTALIDTVVQMAPERVVYVSCDPATLARDLKQFEALGYVTQKVTPVDMFPRTAHVETVAKLTRT